MLARNSNHIPEGSGLESLLLLLAFDAAFYYAYITHKMWQNDKKPVLRIQWNDIGITNEEPYATYRRRKDFEILKSDHIKMFGNLVKGTREEEKIKDKARSYDHLYNSFTDLQIVNDGNGSALNIELDVRYKCDNRTVRRLKNITAIGPHGYTQLKYRDHPGNNRHEIFNNETESYKSPFIIKVKYTDASKERGERIFESDENFNDGFNIIK